MSTQDMPPPGGFANIRVERTLPRPLIRQGIWAAILVGLTFNGAEVMRAWRKRYRLFKTEQVEHYIAASPFLHAETERKFLIHLKTLREEERELMKDHPGWKMGTLYGEPIFKTIPKDQLPPISPIDYYAHRTEAEWIRHVSMPDAHQ